MARIAVMHMVDTLRIGGAERVAVNLANLLPQDEYEAYLCTTRQEGDLATLVAPHVKRVALHRRSTLDPAAIAAAVRFVRKNNIRILHPHASALFFARLVSLFPPYPTVIWHDHYGRYAFNDRPVWLYKLATRKMGGVVAVNRPLEDWSKQALGMPANRVWYIPNFVQLIEGTELSDPLPGKPGARIVCVANIRPQKDHSNLLRALQLIKDDHPEAHVLLIGSYSDKEFRDSVLDQISSMGLADRVTFLGPRHDIPAILRNCDIGVLSSASEGLPLALLEYGMTGLATVATAVGQCPEVLKDGSAGVLVPPSDSEALAGALSSLLNSSSDRLELGKKFRKHVESQYSAAGIIEQICEVYRTVLNGDRLGSGYAQAPMARSAS